MTGIANIVGDACSRPEHIYDEGMRAAALCCDLSDAENDAPVRSLEHRPDVAEQLLEVST